VELSSVMNATHFGRLATVQDGMKIDFSIELLLWRSIEANPTMSQRWQQSCIESATVVTMVSTERESFDAGAMNVNGHPTLSSGNVMIVTCKSAVVVGEISMSRRASLASSVSMLCQGSRQLGITRVFP
jgi:hypothetical protein